MGVEPNPSERTIFQQAIEEEDLDDRLAYLERACKGNQQLRAAVDALLAAHDGPAELLDHPLCAGVNKPEWDDVGQQQAIEHVGLHIGPYKLLEQIGEGGFGMVFVAQQYEPVRRRVALKVLKPGMGSKEVIARFAAERQAVAMMSHTNIAQVFDAGVTADQRPYFVMELVRGLAITEFCDKHQLDIRQRLSILIDVCLAVHHAHQKGVIHRDLKPTNVLVTLHDGRPVPKVIDFGVAKALGEKLTDKTIYTRFFGMVGTPAYMSPEQAEMSGLDVDTRSDIYSLGVVLYELLVGTTPFDRSRLDSVGIDEMRRIIREEEPPRPSMRYWSTTAEMNLSTVVDQRGIDSRRVGSALRGDLDWIVMKCLEKDRSRRYDSAKSLADDIKRYLDGEIVQARAPSTIYKLRKYAVRHRVPLFFTTLVAISMLLGTLASLWQMSKAIGERNAKDQALREATAAKVEAIAAQRQVQRFADDLIHANELVISGQTHADAGRWAEAAVELEAAVKIQPGYYLPRVQRAMLYTQLHLWEEAADDFAVALDTGAPTSQPQWTGVRALFLFTEHFNALEKISKKFDPLETRGPPQWMHLRDLMIEGLVLNRTPEPALTEAQLVAIVRHWLVERPREMPPREIRPREIPSRDKSPRANSPPWDMPPAGGPNRPRPRGPFASPGPEERTPVSVVHYVAGLVFLQVGQYQPAIDELTLALEEDRWPGRYVVYAPLALALFEQGRVNEAKEWLERSDKAIGPELTNRDAQAEFDRNSPWFDLVEGLLLNEKAWQTVHGTSSPLRRQLDQARESALELIGLY